MSHIWKVCSVPWLKGPCRQLGLSNFYWSNNNFATLAVTFYFLSINCNYFIVGVPLMALPLHLYNRQILGPVRLSEMGNVTQSKQSHIEIQSRAWPVTKVPKRFALASMHFPAYSMQRKRVCNFSSNSNRDKKGWPERVCLWVNSKIETIIWVSLTGQPKIIYLKIQ